MVTESMALRTTIVKCAAGNSGCTLGGLSRWVHAAAISPPLDGAIAPAIPSQPSVLPEFYQSSEQNQNHIGFGFPGFSFVGSMELMAVPKKKVSRHKRGIRNGPRALKPVPVIIRCRSCGRVKLPHFYCCSGERGNAGERDNSTS